MALSIYMIHSVSPGIRPKASISPSVHIFSFLGEWELKYPLPRSVMGWPCHSRRAGKFTTDWNQLRQELLPWEVELHCCNPYNYSCRERWKQVFTSFIAVLKIVQMFFKMGNCGNAKKCSEAEKNVDNWRMEERRGEGGFLNTQDWCRW